MSEKSMQRVIVISLSTAVLLSLIYFILDNFFNKDTMYEDGNNEVVEASFRKLSQSFSEEEGDPDKEQQVRDKVEAEIKKKVAKVAASYITSRSNVFPKSGHLYNQLRSLHAGADSAVEQSIRGLAVTQLKPVDRMSIRRRVSKAMGDLSLDILKQYEREIRTGKETMIQALMLKAAKVNESIAAQPGNATIGQITAYIHNYQTTLANTIVEELIKSDPDVVANAVSSSLREGEVEMETQTWKTYNSHASAVQKWVVQEGASDSTVSLIHPSRNVTRAEY
jgi:hypothetical protein